MLHVLITGGTGLIGKALTALLLKKGYGVIILTRTPDKHPPAIGVEYRRWDVKKQTIDPAAIQKADYIVHLAGAGVADKRWSRKRKQEILESRTQSSALLIKAIGENPSNKIKAVVSASAIGWYGADPQIPNPRPFVETDPPDAAFLGDTCRQWEASIDPVHEMGKRLVKLRTGIVLSKEGGALKEFINPLRFGVATILGSGKQIISWIHIDDLCRLYVEAIENGNYSGAFNAVAPKPVSNKALILFLAKQLRGQFYLPVHVPGFALKLAMGEMSIEVLKSATVSSQKVSATGFTFQYPTIESTDWR